MRLFCAVRLDVLRDWWLSIFSYVRRSSDPVSNRTLAGDEFAQRISGGKKPVSAHFRPYFRPHFYPFVTKSGRP